MISGRSSSWSRLSGARPSGCGSTVGSRRACEVLIRQGRVVVNGEVGTAAAATLIEASDEPTLSAFQYGTDGTGADTLLVTKGGLRPEELTPVARQPTRVVTGIREGVTWALHAPLVRTVLERLEKGVHVHVRHHNTHAVGFWEHMGFRVVDSAEKLVLGLRL